MGRSDLPDMLKIDQIGTCGQITTVFCYLCYIPLISMITILMFYYYHKQ